MKVNDYVRTDKGEIGKVISIANDNDFGLGKEYSGSVAFNTEPYVYGNIIKLSPNIIDLIEVGDYVNGDIVIKSAPKDKRKKQEIIIDSTCVEYGELPLRQEDIKSIVTREMFKSMEYKVGEQ